MKQAVGQHSLRELNLAAVVNTIFDSDDPLNRAAIATRTGLTKATVSTLVAQLMDARIVCEQSPKSTGLGRPGIPIAPMAGSITGIGLEVNVHFFGARIIDLAGNTVFEEVVRRDLVGCDPKAILGELGDLANSLIDRANAADMIVAGGRLALPGLVSSDPIRLAVAPNLGWSAFDPVPLLGIGRVAIQTRNEANLAGIAQTPSRPGIRTAAVSASRPNTFIYVSGGAGIGSAIVIDNELFLGQRGWSGEVGHVVVNPDGPPCTCGGRGCLEQYASAAAILRETGFPDIVTFIDAVKQGNLAATAALNEASRTLGLALSDYVNIVDVSNVVLGGFYVRLFDQIAPIVSHALHRGVLSATTNTLTVLPATITEYPALTGGAREVLRAVLERPTEWIPA